MPPLVQHLQMSKVEGQHWWVGLHTYENDGRFRWSDHSVLNYVSWAPGRPRPVSRDRKCVYITSSKGKMASWSRNASWGVGGGFMTDFLCRIKKETMGILGFSHIPFYFSVRQSYNGESRWIMGLWGVTHTRGPFSYPQTNGETRNAPRTCPTSARESMSPAFLHPHRIRLLKPVAVPTAGLLYSGR